MTPAARVDDRCRTIIERLPYGVMVHDEQGDILFANALAGDLVGVTSGDALIGTPITDVFVGPYLLGVRRRLMGLDDVDVGPRMVRRRLTRADGGTVVVEVAATPFLAGRRGEVQLVFNDVDPRLRADEERARTVDALLHLLGEPSWVIWTTDTAGVVVWSSFHGGAASRGAVRMVWRDGAPVATALGAPDDPRIAGALARALRGDVATCEVRVAERTAAIEMGPLRGAAGPVVGTIGLALDVTDRPLRDDRRLERERLDGLARLSGGVAHQFNNLLAIIMARVETMRRESTAGPEVAEDLDAVIAATRRGGEVVEQLLGFARGGSYQRENVDVAALIDVAAARITVDASGAVAVRVEHGPDAMRVRGDARQLALALHALTTNALEATPAHGGVTLRAIRVALTAAELGGVEVAPNGFVAIEVADRGPGMPREVLARAFEPYFSTRGDGRGLGLSMVYGVAHHHGGLVRFISEAGVGTRAQLILPLLSTPEAPTARAAPPVEGPLNPPHRGVALLVDDEAQVRRALRRLVARLGYVVVEAEDGEAALAAFTEARAEPFALVLLDMRMPGMSGDEVLRRMLAIDPGVRVIICTGFADEELVRSLAGLGHVGLLLKPFGMAELQAQIAAVTSGRYDEA